MAQHRHKRETNARRPKAIQVAGPIAIMATVSAVSLGVLTATPQNDNLLATPSSAGAGDISAAAGSLSNAVTRDDIVSRSESRLLARKIAKREAKQEQKATLRAIERADTKLWTTTELNLWSGPEKQADKLGVLDGIEKVLLTGRKDNDRVEVVIDGKSRWVSAGYLTDEKPETGPSLGGACTNGSVIDAGRASLYEIHDAVCANWPEITSYGTWRNDGEHGEGRAIDIMISGDTGWEIAEFLRANYSALGIEYIIYSQKMWSVERSGEGWRYMSDRGSTTANHYDHVHVTVY
ncbi:MULTISPECIES: SH3 domain-containing protein [Nocardioides]|uniref:SH3 domain-containing protein n=1 Tax=Nocardioides TaxID=1839 RepID=UPI00032E4630|nr:MULTISPECIES: SH3 domain-containing protein [Nocardioides]EON24403.1 hypothetical protein CF8_1614 [Nocardioides sp. CF8]